MLSSFRLCILGKPRLQLVQQALVRTLQFYVLADFYGDFATFTWSLKMKKSLKTLLLTGLMMTAGGIFSQDAMSKDAAPTAKDVMPKAAVGKDGVSKDAMAKTNKKTMSKNAMNKDGMTKNEMKK